MNLTDILILSTSSIVNLPVLTDSNGKNERDLDFIINLNTEVYHSCSLTWRGEHYVFGGHRMRQQIAKIHDCALMKIGKLQHNFIEGACSNVADQYIYLCFGIEAGERKRCRKLTSPTGTNMEIDLSFYPHAKTRIASSSRKISIHVKAYHFLGRVLALGNYGSQVGDIKINSQSFTDVN